MREAVQPAGIDSAFVRFSNLTIDSVSGAEVTLRVDIAWRGSWREVPSRGGGQNWDAAWVFVKFLYNGQVSMTSGALVKALDAGDEDAVHEIFSDFMANRIAPLGEVSNVDALSVVRRRGLEVAVNAPGR